MNRSSRLLFSGICFAACCAFGQTTPDNTVAYVFEIQGDWRIAPQYASGLVRGMALHNHDVVALRGEPAGAYIHVGLLDGTVGSRDCRSAPNECAQPLEVSLTTADRTIPQRMQAIWSRLTISASPAPVFTMSRGIQISSVDARESVLALQGGMPDFAPALAGLERGVFDAELTSLGEDSRVVPLGLRWEPPKALAKGPSIRAGLYTLQLMPGGRPIVVLVTTPRQAAVLRTDFVNAAQVSSGWPDDMASARHDYLAAVLMQLSERLAPAK